MLGDQKTLNILRTGADIFMMTSSFIFAAFTSPFHQSGYLTTTDSFFLFVLILVWLFSAKVTSLYDEFTSHSYSYTLIIVLKNVLVQTIAGIIFIFAVKDIPFQRTFIILYTAALTVSLGLEKYLFGKALLSLRRRGKNMRNILIVGAGKAGMELYRSIKTDPELGCRVLGFLDDKKSNELNGQYLGDLKQLERILAKRQVDDVIVALPNSENSKIGDIVNVSEKFTTRVRIVPDYSGFSAGKYSVSLFGSMPVISVKEERLNEMPWNMLKRIFDLSLTLLLFVFLFSWLWPVIIVVIKLTTKGSVFYKQERRGKNNRKFVVYKFRTLHQDSRQFDENGNFLQVTRDDPRVTVIGRFLRRTNLDELPQFINVLKGDMSLVGPRPHLSVMDHQFREKIRSYMLRYSVKPGLTGWAQVNGLRGETRDPELMNKRVEYDFWYIENWSFGLDLHIILLTILKMLKGDPNAY